MNPRNTHKKMSRLSCSPVQCLLRPLPLLFILSMMSQISQGDVGTAARYSPPYLPTACYNDSASQFPSNNLFAAAGDGIWDNGAACGRQYLVRCISAAVADSCIADQVIQVKIVDYIDQVSTLSQRHHHCFVGDSFCGYCKYFCSPHFH